MATSGHYYYEEEEEEEEEEGGGCPLQQLSDVGGDTYTPMAMAMAAVMRVIMMMAMAMVLVITSSGVGSLSESGIDRQAGRLTTYFSLILIFYVAGQTVRVWRLVLPLSS